MAVHVRYTGGSGVVIGEAGPMAPGDVMTVESEEAAEKFTRRGDFEVVAQVDSPDAPAEDAPADAPAPDAPAEEEGDVEKAADAPDAPAEAPEEAPPAEETTGDEGAAEAAPSAGTQE